MRAIVTSLCMMYAGASVEEPMCTSLPAGTYRSPLGSLGYLKIQAMSPNVFAIETELDSEAELDSEHWSSFRWRAYEKALNGLVQFEMQPDCTFKITDPKSQSMWRTMFMVLSDSLGQYAGIHGLVGKYDPIKEAIVVGGWLEMPRDK